jgi:hypothetical protein
MKVGFRTDTGRKRAVNEDALLVLPGQGLFAVADGVGGGNAGELASRSAVNGIEEFLKNNPIANASDMEGKYRVNWFKGYFFRCFRKINGDIRSIAKAHPESAGMATTAVTAYFDGGSLYITNKHLLLDSVRHIVRRLPQFRVIKGVPIDARRLECDPAEIDEYYQVLESLLEDFPAAMIINIDETGHQEWADSHPERVVVPVDYQGATMRIPVSRETKRATLLAAITADGHYLKPLVVIPRQTCDAELFQIGFTPEKILYASQENGFIDTELFDWWTREVLFPYVSETRERLKYNGQALVILDGCTCHSSDFFLDEATHEGVRPLFLPAHSSDQTQPLDLGIFGLDKSEAARTRPSPTLNPQTRQIVKALNGYQKACCPNNITSAFRRAGIVTHWSAEHHALVARVDRTTAANVRHWTFDRTRISVHHGLTEVNQLA